MVDIRYQPRQNRAVSQNPPSYFSASWKGIPFFCDGTADEFGRRGDLYEYPLSDRTGYKDLGRRARRFKVDGYLIGEDQVERSVEMARAAEDPEPGTLEHPMHGSQLVACVTLSMTAEYRKDKKRTKLAFEFVEANQSLAPYRVGDSVDSIFNDGSDAVAASRESATWDPSGTDVQMANDFNAALQNAIMPGTDEQSLDSIDMLNRGNQTLPSYMSPGTPFAITPLATQATTSANAFPTFTSVVGPIDYGSATVRRIHTDALTRLRDFNAFVVNRTERVAVSASIQSLVVTTRLITIRDYAIAVAQKRYATVKDALDDLDFIMAAYDEELQFATERCDDILVAAIYHARATAANVILSRAIRLPGIVEAATDGLWPSLVVAQKLYADGTRYQDVENYNATMLPFWMGRKVIAPAS